MPLTHACSLWANGPAIPPMQLPVFPPGMPFGTDHQQQPGPFALLPSTQTGYVDAAVKSTQACKPSRSAISKDARSQHGHAKASSKTTSGPATQRAQNHDPQKSWLSLDHSTIPRGMSTGPDHLITPSALMTEALKTGRNRTTSNALKTSANKEQAKQSPAAVKRGNGVSARDSKTGAGLRSKRARPPTLPEAASQESTDQQEELNNQQVVLMRMINAMAQVWFQNACPSL
jgi:hypothetical protein